MCVRGAATYVDVDVGNISGDSVVAVIAGVSINDGDVRCGVWRWCGVVHGFVVIVDIVVVVFFGFVVDVVVVGVVSVGVIDIFDIMDIDVDGVVVRVAVDVVCIVDGDD